MDDKTLCAVFDRFCRRVLRNAALDCFAEEATRRKYEMSLEECYTVRPLEDSYFAVPHFFPVVDYVIPISNPEIGCALSALSDEKREIILLTCCLGLPDRAVAERLSMVRRTVAYKRAKALQELSERLKDAEL